MTSHRSRSIHNIWGARGPHNVLGAGADRGAATTPQPSIEYSLAVVSVCYWRVAGEVAREDWRLLERGLQLLGGRLALFYYFVRST
jgi:hypothetical protein